MSGRVLVLLLLGGSLASGQPEPVVATHYFIWYRYPDEHFNLEGDPRREGHFHHFANPEKVDYRSPEWHAGEFRDMAAAGIDVALPVYWGAPGAYHQPHLRFSRDSLGPMVTALRQLREKGEPGVKLGLFYDTSTLLRSVRQQGNPEEKADLTTAAGADLFCGTVTGFFEQIPADLWARMEGRALVVLYVSGFAARWEADLAAILRRAFARRFPGEDLFLVADATWGEIGQDLTTSWGAALAGPKIFPGLAQIGPGYDDSPVPGRRTPRRDREDGNLYRFSWRRAVLARPRLVLLETWNEMHEGTEICRTVETGTLYLDLTRSWVRRLKEGLEPGPEIPLGELGPQSRPDHSWGQEAQGRSQVEAVYTGAKPRREGLREVSLEDGPLALVNGRLEGRGPPGRASYLYFQVSDAWRFDDDAALELQVVQLQGGPLELEYDSRLLEATLGGAYTRAAVSGRRQAEGRTLWTFTLPRARLANRQNGDADFRLVLQDVPVAVASLTLRPRDPPR